MPTPVFLRMAPVCPLLILQFLSRIQVPAHLVPEANTQDAGVLSIDPWLEPFQDALKRRYSKAQSWIETIDKTEGGLDKFSRVSYKSAFVPIPVGTTKIR